MNSYVVMERDAEHADVQETAFIRDAFSIWALIFPLFWLLWYRLWLAALFFSLGSIGLAFADGAFMGPVAVTVAGLLVGLIVALEGPVWRIGKMRRKGYVEAGAVQAENAEEAEIRWFHRPQPEPAAAALPPVRRMPVERDGHGTDMLLGYSGER